MPRLATSHRVIRIDLLGHGNSSKPAGGGYTIPEHAQRVGAALDRLGVESAVVVGHSTGGSVATGFSRGFKIPQPLLDDVRRVTYHAFTATAQGAVDYLEQRSLQHGWRSSIHRCW